MNSPRLRGLISHRLFRIGLVVQLIAAATVLGVFLLIRLGWIDIVALGLENGIDNRSPKLDLLYGVICSAVFAFAAAFGLYGWALHRINVVGQGEVPDARRS